MARHGTGRWIGAGLAAIVVVIALWLIVPPFAGLLWGPDERRVSIVDEVVAVELRVPDRLAITRVSADASGEGCTSVRYAFGQSLAVESYSDECDLAGEQRILNGRHGEYRTIDDVPDPRDVEEVATDLGPATLFEQEYTECTNFCRDFEEPIAIIALEDPRDSAYTSVVLQAPKGDIDRDELREILTTLQAVARDR